MSFPEESFAERSRHAGIVLVAATLLAPGCAGSTGSVEREVQPMVLGLMDRLNPDGGRVSAFSGLRRDTTGVQASWEIEPGIGLAGVFRMAARPGPD